MVERNLFPYDLAVVAIFKDEARYLREWLDYHLIAGVEHFYLYNNDSSDNFAEVLAPYVEAGLVTLTDWPGKIMQNPAYDDALLNFRHECRYMAFIDLDEFIYPKDGRTIAEVVDEILSSKPNAAAVAINWQTFGSNGQEAADYSRGVLERFTRRAPDDWSFISDDGINSGNTYIKSVVNPRRTKCFFGPHYAIYFGDLKSINARGEETFRAGNKPVSTEKIVVNHYYTKSREEYMETKMRRGWACANENPYCNELFNRSDRNEVFDDGILHYRDARAEVFAMESDAERFSRAEKTLIETLTQCSPFNAPPKFLTDKLETFLTCRALAERFGTQIGSRSAEEFALVWIYQTLLNAATITQEEFYQFLRDLPEILARPFPFCRKLKLLVQDVIIPRFCAAQKFSFDWEARAELLQIQKFLRLIE